MRADRRNFAHARLPPSSNISTQARERLDPSAIASREAGLHKELSRPQLIMIGLGGAIGTGLFMGSGVAIGYAGPAVIVSYAIAAIAAVAIVFSLSEMAVMHPTAGSFGTYAEIYLNPWAGIIARYSYWHDVPVSAWRMGPIDLLVVHPAVLLDLQAWERMHPLDEQRTIA